MRFMMLVPANADSEAGKMPPRELFEAMAAFNQEMIKAGVLLAGDGLAPSSKGKIVRFDAGGPTVIDGPFTESKELIAGFMIWQVRSMEEAVEWVRRSPSHYEDSEVEIRPLFEAADFGENLTPELEEQGRQLRDQVARKKNA